MKMFLPNFSQFLRESESDFPSYDDIDVKKSKDPIPTTDVPTKRASKKTEKKIKDKYQSEGPEVDAKVIPSSDGGFDVKLSFHIDIDNQDLSGPDDTGRSEYDEDYEEDDYDLDGKGSRREPISLDRISKNTPLLTDKDGDDVFIKKHTKSMKESQFTTFIDENFEYSTGVPGLDDLDSSFSDEKGFSSRDSIIDQEDERDHIYNDSERFTDTNDRFNKSDLNRDLNVDEDDEDEFMDYEDFNDF